MKIPSMERVLGVEVNGIHKAYPFSILKKNSAGFADRVGGKVLLIQFNRKSETTWVSDEAGTTMPSVTVFWFAWLDFYPQTLVYR